MWEITRTILSTNKKQRKKERQNLQIILQRSAMVGPDLNNPTVKKSIYETIRNIETLGYLMTPGGIVNFLR